MRRKTGYNKNIKRDSYKSAKNNAQEYIEKCSDAEILYVLCDVLGVLGRDLAYEFDVTTAQISHYRQGRAAIPKSRILDLIKIYKKALKANEEALRELTQKKRKTEIEKLVVEHLKARIELGKKVLEKNIHDYTETD
jgi:hypothetical protein